MFKGKTKNAEVNENTFLYQKQFRKVLKFFKKTLYIEIS